MEGRARILVVEDDPDLLRATSRLLKKAGHEVTEATTGSEGLRMAVEQGPDLVLLDVVLPDMDGLEVCRRIKGEPTLASSFVVLISGLKTAPDNRAQGLEAGADGYIVRPISNREWIAQTEAMLRIKRAEDGQRQALAEALQTSQALRESEQRYRSLVEQSLDGIRLIDERGTIVEWNKRCEEILGLQRVEALGQPIWDVLYQLMPDERKSPAAYERLKSRTLESLSSGDATWRDAEQVYTVQHPDGTRRLVEERVFPIWSDGASLLCGIIRDVTERVRAEEALRERTRQLGERVKELDCLYGMSALVERPGISLTEMLQGTVDLMPPAWQYPEITGARIILESQEFKTENFSETVAWQQAAEVLVHGQHSGTVEVCYLEERPPRDEGPFLNDERDLINAIAQRLGRIIERVRAQELLGEQNQFIVSVFESLAHPFYVVDANDYTVKMANSAAYRGELPEAITCYALAHGRRTPCGDHAILCPLEEVRKTKQPATVEHTHCDRDGRERVYEVHAHPMLDAEGNVTQIIGYTLDVTERRRAEQALEETTTLLETILEHTHVLIAYLDPQFNFIRVNRAYAEADEREPSFFPGKNHFELYPNPENEAIFRRVVETGEPYLVYARPFEYAEHPERGVSYWDWSLFPIKGAGGTATGLVLSLTNVTERVQAGAALRESEKKYRQLIELAQEGVWTVDADALTTFVNPRMAEMLGYTMEEMQGRHLFSFMDERGVEICQRNLERRQQGIKEQHDFELLHKDGTRIYTSMETSPITDENGDYVGALALVADITERRRAEQALRRARDELELRVQERTAELVQANERLQAEIIERRRVEAELRRSEERFRQLAENINEVFWMTDLNENQVLYVSPTFERVWGRPRERLYRHPQSFLDGVHPEDREQVSALLERQSHEETDETYRIARPDGSVRWIRARTFPIWNVLGRVYRVAGIAEDITERVQAYQVLEQRVEERTRELSTLLEISRHVALTLELEPLLYLILDQLKAVVDYDDATVFKLEGGELICLAHRGTVPEEEMVGQRFSLEQAPFGHQMILNQETVIIADVQGEAPLARDFRQVTGARLDTLYARVSSWMGVPLTIKDQVMGLLTLKHRAADHFTPDQENLVLGFANQAAVAIENNRLYEQAQALAAMEERQRLARDLHDAVSQTLFSASLAAEVLPRLWENRPEEGRRCLVELRQLTRGALAEMRTLLLELRPAALMEVELDELLRQLVEAASSRARLPVDLTVEGQASLPPEVHVTLYRIAQEALNNVVKHAGASRAAVSLRCAPALPSAGGDDGTGRVELRVEDDGRGFDPADVPAESLGLSIMRERAATVGAEMRIESRVGHGTEVVIAWPGAAC